MVNVGLLIRQKLAERIFSTMNAGEAIERRFNGLIFRHALEFHERFDIFDERISRQTRKLAPLVFQNGSAVHHLGSRPVSGQSSQKESISGDSINGSYRVGHCRSQHFLQPPS